MGVDAAWPLQCAVIGRLKGDDKLKEFIGNPPRIFEKPQASADEPRIEIGDSEANAWQSATFDGQEHELTFHVWSREGGSSKSKEIASRVIDLLHNADFVVPGHALVDLQFEASETRFRTDIEMFHCQLIFKGLTVTD